MSTEHHYFGSAISFWVVGETLDIVKEKMKEEVNSIGDIFIAIYKVPVSISEPYDIEWYAPVVDGTELVVANSKFFKPDIQNVEYVGDKL